jgi:hypothetical protein
MSKISDIKEGEAQPLDYGEGDWTIVCMNSDDNGLDGLEYTIGPFSEEEALQFALIDKRCGEDVHWVIIPNRFPASFPK